MAVYDIINSILGPVLDPVLRLSPLVAMILLSFLLALLITVIYKYMTNQQMMKELKDDMKRMQNEMKQLKNNPQKMMEVQKRAMEKNMKYMMHSMKPTLITFIPLILIFGWLSANFAYEPVAPGKQFSMYIFLEDPAVGSNASISLPEGLRLVSANVTPVVRIDKADNPDRLPFKNKDITSKRYGGIIEVNTEAYYAGWNLTGKKGEYSIEYVVGGNSYFRNILVSDVRYAKPIEKISDGKVRGTLVDQGKLIVMNLFGWRLGWLGTYIIFSIIFSMALRKVMKVY